MHLPHVRLVRAAALVAISLFAFTVLADSALAGRRRGPTSRAQPRRGLLVRAAAVATLGLALSVAPAALPSDGPVAPARAAASTAATRASGLPGDEDFGPKHDPGVVTSNEDNGRVHGPSAPAEMRAWNAQRALAELYGLGVYGDD
jgi:hypothetical protein